MTPISLKIIYEKATSETSAGCPQRPLGGVLKKYARICRQAHRLKGAPELQGGCLRTEDKLAGPVFDAPETETLYEHLNLNGTFTE